MSDDGLFPGAVWSRYNYSRVPMKKQTSSRRAGHHWTANRVGTEPAAIDRFVFDNAGPRTGYHLYMPLSRAQRPIQTRPWWYAAGSLLNDGETLPSSPNSQGMVNFQIGWICTRGDDPLAKGPGEWWDDLLDWLVSVVGVPKQYVHENWTPNALMPTSAWLSSASGHYAHKNTPEKPYPRKPDPGAVIDRVIFGKDGGNQPTPPPVTTFKYPVLGGDVTLGIYKVTDPYQVSREVRTIQFLVESFRIDGLPVGELAKDSVYGPRTRDAVRVFQEAKGLTVDGIVGPVTWGKLLEG